VSIISASPLQPRLKLHVRNPPTKKHQRPPQNNLVMRTRKQEKQRNPIEVSPFPRKQTERTRPEKDT